jgi:ribosomal protein S18 acetylase RimI-like enzyme
MIYERATLEDLQEILDLQHLAFKSEAKILNNFNIPPMVQDYAGIKEEFDKGIFLKAVDNGKIVGSARGYIEDGTGIIRKLIVHPEYRCRGIGSKLLYKIEQALDVKRYVAFTSNKSVSNLALVEVLGYRIFKKEEIAPNLTYIYLEKVL